MNHDLLEKLRRKLDAFTISDYHGLHSPGLTCYLNCVLQVLFMTEDFREAVKWCFSNPKATTTIDPYLSELFTGLQRNTAKTHDIAEKLGIENLYEQRDAAEYFERILCLTSPEAAKMFRGELNHMTTCLWCNKKINSRGFFWILPLAVEDGYGQTYCVEKGLKAFFQGGNVCGDNNMFCDRCDTKREAHIGCEMSLHPEILTLLLKRFSFDYKRRCYVKLRCKVDIPQTLRVEEITYDLYAVVNHIGNLTGGHYTTQIKSFETQVWYHFNDDIVTVARTQFGARDTTLRSSSAYLLMYKKASRRPEKTFAGDHEAPCAQSDVKAKGRRGAAKIGSDMALRYSGVEYLNGDISERTQEAHFGTQKSQTSREPNGRQLNTNSEDLMSLLCIQGTLTERLRTLQVNPESPKKRQKATETEGESHRHVHAFSLTGNKDKITENKVTNKEEASAEVRIETKSIQRRKATVSAHGFLPDGKSRHVSSNGCSSSSAPHGHNEMSTNEHIGCRFSPNPSRQKSNRSESVEEKRQPVVSAGKTVARGEGTASPRGRRKAAKANIGVHREPWK